MFLGAGLTCVRSDRTVFRDVDFALDVGECLMIMGENGSGKSSLLRIMARLLSPSTGRLLWYGDSVSRETPSTRYLGHADAIKLSQTPFETLLFWARLADPATAAERVEKGLDRLEIGAYRDLPNRHLSAGQRRRVGLGRFLLSPVALWLIDEPLLTLDSRSQALFYSMVEEYCRSGGRVAATTHNRFPLENTQTLLL